MAKAPEQKHFEDMEPPRIGSLTAAVRRAHEKGKARAAAQLEENAARDTVARLMHENEEALTHPDSGDLIYKVDGIVSRIAKGKEKLTITAKKPKEAGDDDGDDEEGDDIFDAEAGDA